MALTEDPPVGGDLATRFVDGRRFRMLIGADLVEAGDGGTRTIVDPSTGRDLVDVPEARRADVDRAVEEARRAQRGWYELGLRGRTEVLHALAEAMHEDRVLELAALDALSAGNPLRAMIGDVRYAIQQIDDWASLALALRGHTVPATVGNLHYTIRQPFGVVGRIVPYNHPGYYAIAHVLQPLVVGNAVVLKPAHQTPLSALALGEIVSEVLPPGVLNIVSGGAEAGEAIVTHPRIKRIAFTGSVGTGMRVQEMAARAGVKEISLELGGKNAMVVFPDAPLDDVVEGAFSGMNFDVCQGQACGSNSRVFVHRRLYEPFVECVAERLRGLRLGAAADPDTDMGPVITAAHRDRVLDYVRSARADGARLVVGGGRPSEPALDGGFFVEPTLFADATMDMRFAREEIFGPVMSVHPWDDYEEVVDQANALDLGLTASVWTSDIDLALKTAHRLEAGYVWVNDSRRHYWGMPFGGVKSSGVGREESLEELESYLELKSVNVLLKDPLAVLRRDRGATPA
jgi:acyl-CoA reductase-like NAD-dependent aldehyde dehydrogenase